MSVTKEIEDKPIARRMTRSRRYIVLFWIVSLSLWLVPFFVTGWTRKTWTFLPRPITYQHSASALFTTVIKGWRDYHIEWQRSDGKWFEIKEQILYPNVRYGHRTRFDIILSRNDSPKKRDSLYQRLAVHTVKQGRLAGVIDSNVVGVRFVAVSWPMGDAALTEAPGAWKDTRLSTLPSKWQRVVAQFEIKGSSIKATKATSVSGKRSTTNPNPPITTKPPVNPIIAPVSKPTAPITPSSIKQVTTPTKGEIKLAPEIKP